ncbi:MAG: iron-sulfur cluster assembly protein, partial [Bacteroidetes bacterium]|nr:iron-sulfur cluster assembly protein [Bacteroidota bacterium]
MAYTEEQILQALGTVKDPDLGKDLVSLKMIENVEISDGKVSFTVVLTTPACPLVEKIKEDCVSAIHQHVDANIEIIIEITSRVTSIRNDNRELLPKVQNIIAVAS